MPIRTARVGQTTNRHSWASRLWIPVDAVGCCNWTGDWSDSPCPTSVVEAELKEFCKLLRKEKIKYKRTVEPTSNVFCQKVYILVDDQDRSRALELAAQHEKNTRLFYTVQLENRNV